MPRFSTALASQPPLLGVDGGAKTRDVSARRPGAINAAEAGAPVAIIGGDK